MARIWLSNQKAEVVQSSSWQSTSYYKAFVDTRNPQRPALTAAITAMTAGALTNTYGNLTTASAGTFIAWITQPFAAAVPITAVPVLCNVWASESSSDANVGLRLSLHTYAAASESTAFLTSTVQSAELGSMGCVRWETSVPTATTIQLRDRLVIRLADIALATTSGSRFMTMDYDGPTEGADGDTYFDINEPIRVNQSQLYGGSVAAAPGFGGGIFVDTLRNLDAFASASLIASNTTVQQLQDGLGYERGNN